MNIRLPLVLFLILFQMVADAAEIEIWTNREGKEIRAALLGIEGGNAKLQRPDGATFVYPVGNLSLDSQAKAVALDRELKAQMAVAHIPAVYRKRNSMNSRMEAIRAAEGIGESASAVRKALGWIATHQNADGSFGSKYTVGVTGMSCLAFWGHNETQSSPEYGENAVNATLFLMDRALKGDGLIFNGEKGHHVAYEHAIATIALAELFGMTKDSKKAIPRLEKIVAKAVGLILDGQTDAGIWAYDYNQEGMDDMSLAGWQIQALMAAKRSGIEFSGVDRALERSVSGILVMQDEQGAFKYRAKDAVGKISLTGSGLYGLQMNGATASPEYKKGVAYLSGKLTSPTVTRDFYSSYYNVMALHRHGGEEWNRFHGVFIPKLLNAQNEEGSWDGGGTRGIDGEILQTAWGALMLEVYYRYGSDS